jgi:hypothetical protein
MDAEFGTVAEWTAEVAESLGSQYRIPAACRGSGWPSALDWLLAGLAPRSGDLMIDIGAGLGGPSAYAAERTGVRPVLATRDRLDNPPEGNHFPSRAQLTVLLREAGLTETAAADPAFLPAPAVCWRERTAAVDDELRRRFRDAPPLVTALEQSHRIGQLLQSGELVSQVIRLHRAA